MKLKSIFLILICLSISSCTSGDKKPSAKSDSGPKTGYGQAVAKAKDLAESEKQRAKKIDDDLKDDNEQGDEGGE